MKFPSYYSVAARLVRVALALALFAGPSVAQVTAAELCRTRCNPATLVGQAGCCGEHDAPAADRSSGERRDADGQEPAGTPSGSGAKFCPGCNGRPLALDTPRLTVSLDPAPLFAPAFGPMTSASVDVPFAIFHPPRA